MWRMNTTELPTLNVNRIQNVAVLVSSLVWPMLCAVAWLDRPLVADEPIRPIKVEYLWQSEPKLNFLWREPPRPASVSATAEQLQSERALERMSVAQSIIRVPDSPSFEPGPMLTQVMERLKSEQDAQIQAELITAACQLDEQGVHADRLWQLAKDRLLVQGTVETACIRWTSTAPLSTWRQRIESLKCTQVNCSAPCVGSAQVVNRAISIVLVSYWSMPLAMPIRFDCARAYGRLAARTS